MPFAGINHIINQMPAIIELSVNMTGLLVRSSWFCIEQLPCLVSFWCILGDINKRAYYFDSLSANLMLTCQEVLK